MVTVVRSGGGQVVNYRGFVGARGSGGQKKIIGNNHLPAWKLLPDLIRARVCADLGL
jgi:hypothetical protein